MEFNKTLLLIVSLSSLLLSCNAVPSSFLGFDLGGFSFSFPPELAPSLAPELAPSSEPEFASYLEQEFAPSLAPNSDGGIKELSDGVGTGLLDNFKALLPAEVLDSTVSQLCKDVENITLCTNTIAPYIHGQADPVKAVEIEIDALHNHTQKIADFVAKLIADNNGRDKKLGDALKVCKENYQNNLVDIGAALEAIKTVDMGRAQSMLSAVIGFLETCKDTFTESGLEFPFPDDSDAVYQLAGNCLAILNKIHFN